MCLVLARFRKIIISQDNNFTEINGSKRDMRIWSNIREYPYKNVDERCGNYYL